MCGSLNRATRTQRPRFNEINWDLTIRANLKHYVPEQKTIIAEKLVGRGHKRSSLRDIVLCVDQSGSMAASLVYSGIFGAVLASIRAVSTRMVVFDTAVVDLTDDLQDPVDLSRAPNWRRHRHQPRLCLLSANHYPTGTDDTGAYYDLYEGGNQQEMLRRSAELVASGAQVICLLALSDKGTPSFDRGTRPGWRALAYPPLPVRPTSSPK